MILSLKDSVFRFKLLEFFLVISLFFGFVGTQKVYAQYCGSQIDLDKFYCEYNIATYECDWNYAGWRDTYSCTADPNDCRTTNRACSSNDDAGACRWDTSFNACVVHTDECSYGACWVNPPPTPTPPPGSSMFCGTCPGSCIYGDPDQCAGVGDTDGDGACEGVCGTPTPPPPPSAGTVSGRVYCDALPGDPGISGVNVQVRDSTTAQVGTAITSWPSGNYSISFLPTGGFAVRPGLASDGTRAGYTGAGTSYCGGFKHEACPFVANMNESGFDFLTNRIVPDSLGVTCDADSGTFTWNEYGGADRYILRVNYEDGTWVSGNDYWLYVPTTVGLCNGSTCSVTLDSGAPVHPFLGGSYEGWSVQVEDEGEVHCQRDGGPFTCGVVPTTCEVPTNLAGGGACGVDGLLDVTWTWNEVDGATKYLLQMDDVDPYNWSGGGPDGLAPYDDYVFPASCSGGTCSHTFYNVNPGTWYGRVRVEQSDGSCIESFEWTTPMVTYTNSCRFTVSGTVYEGNGTLSGEVCNQNGPRTGVRPGDDAQVVVSGTGGTYSDPNIDDNPAGDYYIPNVLTGTYTISLTDHDSPPWECNCPGGCSNTLTVDGNETRNIYLDQEWGGWWQSEGGDVGTDGGGMTSAIPATCAADPGCKEYLTLRDGLVANSSGVLVHNGGTVDLGDGEESEETDYVANSDYLNPHEGYDYFWRLFEMGDEATAVSDDDFGNPEINAQEPPAAAAADAFMPGAGVSGGSNGIKYAYFYRGNMKIANPWTIGADEWVVIFVDGDLTINPPVNAVNGNNGVEVTEGGFLGFVVSGNVYVAQAEGVNASVTNSWLEGVYIVDGTIHTGGTTLPTDKFVGEGIFVGWGGVNLQRDFDSDDNNTYPAELFRYRPDLVLNAPERFKKPVYSWQEVAP